MSKIYIYQIPGIEDFAASISLEPLCNGDGINDYNYYQMAKKHAIFLSEYADMSVTFFPKDNPADKKTISFLKVTEVSMVDAITDLKQAIANAEALTSKK